MECNLLLDEFATVSETVKAIKLLSSGKVPGPDAITAEIYKAGGTPVAKKMTELFHIMWRKEANPKKIQGCVSYPSIQTKRESSTCDNHCGISLLSVAGKVLARVLLNQLNECGFRKDRGTIDMIFTASQLHEKCQEQNMDLYMTFVDPTEAFYTGSREGLWNKYGEVWLSDQVHSNGDAVPRWYACKGPK